MNDIFELKRFGLLLKKTILERPIQLVGLTGLILTATLIIYSGFLYFGGWQPAQNLGFIWGLVGGGCFLSSVVFGYFGTNASGSAYLTLPASSFEKWLCGVIIVGILFTLIFFGFYRLMDTCFVTVYHNGLNKNDPQYKNAYDAVRTYTFDNNIARQGIIIYTNFVGAMMVGSLYFNRVSAIKTALVYGSIVGLIFLLNLAIANAFFQNVEMAFPFHNIFIGFGDDYGSLELPAISSAIVGISMAYIIPIVLWITAYIRLTEKEI
jgi:hypothetical protein